MLLSNSCMRSQFEDIDMEELFGSDDDSGEDQPQKSTERSSQKQILECPRYPIIQSDGKVRLKKTEHGRMKIFSDLSLVPILDVFFKIVDYIRCSTISISP